MGNDLSSWFEQCKDGASLYVRGRMQQYEPLNLFRDRLVTEGTGRAWEVAKYVERYDVQFGPDRFRYFSRLEAFDRWLKIASYRETLRLVLGVETVEAPLLVLPDEMRFVLRLRDVDQFTDDDVARALSLKTDRWPFVDAEGARQRSISAYMALCERLEMRFPNRPHFAVFPLYPGITRIGWVKPSGDPS